MKKRFMSGKLRNIYFQKGKKIISKNIATFLKKNNLNKIIRLQKIKSCVVMMYLKNTVKT
ncbi:MAG: hypothetical protein FD544_000013 [Pelagibacterales bacterium]|nr:hypothetical protein [Pelagibacterales bacterium]